jgi:uncharacterized protein (TIGR03437 family)
VNVQPLEPHVSIAPKPAVFDAVYNSLHRVLVWFRYDPAVPPQTGFATRRNMNLRKIIPTRLKILWLLALCCFIASPASSVAQSPMNWRALAPLEGASVTTLLNVGGAVFAATRGRGVWVSRDQGRTWQAASQGLGEAAQVFNLAFTLVFARINLLALTTTGVYRSTDGGQTWTLSGPNLSSQFMSPARPGALAVSTEAAFVIGPTGVVFSSSDGGQNWQERGRLPVQSSPSTLAAQGNTLLAGTATGLYRSTDQGQNWQLVTGGLPRNGIAPVSAIAAAGDDWYLGVRVLRAPTPGNEAQQVYRSTSGGLNWSPAGTLIAADLGGTTLYPTVSAFNFDGAQLLIGTELGVFALEGGQWRAVAGNRGLPTLPLVTAFARLGANLLVGSANAGIHQLAADGQRWNASNGGLAAASVNALAVSGENIFASTAAGLSRSADNGQSWTALSNLMNGAGRPLTVTHLATRGTNLYAATTFDGIYISTDQGATWRPLNDGLQRLFGITDLVAAENGLYALDEDRVYRLDDGANRWTPLNRVAFTAGGAAVFVSTLAVSGSRIYVMGLGGLLLRSINGGADFQEVAHPAGTAGLFTIGVRGNRVFLGNDRSASVTPATSNVYFANDDGQATLNFSGSFSTLFVRKFVFSESAAYAVTPTGVSFSANDGLNWTPVNAGLGNRAVTTLAVKGDTLLAGANGFGVYAASQPHLQAGTLATVSAADFRADVGVAADSIAAVFGAGLAPQTGGAVPGVSVAVRDQTGSERAAQLFFVSPTQINFLVPRDTVEAGATVIVTNAANGTAAHGKVEIRTVAPGLFAANANGQGVAAAVALRIRSDGAQQYEPVAEFDATTGRFVARLLDLGPASDQLFLVLFGTGIRGHRGLSGVTASIGGIVSLPVLFAGAQGQLAGLDQVNVSLPRSLAGRGEVNVMLSVDGKTTNAVSVRIR